MKIVFFNFLCFIMYRVYLFLTDLSLVLYENNISSKTTNEIWQTYCYEHFLGIWKHSWMYKLYNVNSSVTRHNNSCQPTATRLWEEDGCHVSYLHYGFCPKWYSFNNYYLVEWTYINLINYKSELCQKKDFASNSWLYSSAIKIICNIIISGLNLLL